MKMNFKGLVDLHTLPKTTPLLPLYEAIINSIQSIEDAQISNGKIEIIVERDKQMNLFNQWETDIENIIIVDNGIGFDDENYNSFDTYASLGMLTINALVAADSVIVPVQAHYLPLKGMTQLMKTIGKVQRQLNPNLKIDGVLLTLADMRTKLARTTEDSLRENYGKHIRIFKTVIPVAITAAESSAAGQSIYEYDKNGTVAKAYAEFTREVIQCGEKQRNKHESSFSR